MGSLKAFALQPFIDKYALEYFFETGTGIGESFRYAQSFPFLGRCTVDVDPNAVAIRRSAFDITFTSDSVSALSNYRNNGNTLFFLDAHCPNCYSGAGFNDEQDEKLRLPLRWELEVILARQGKDVIIIDDLRIYEQGDFATGNLTPDFAPPKPEARIDEVLMKFEQTHNITRDYRNEGYLILTPKQ